MGRKGILIIIILSIILASYSLIDYAMAVPIVTLTPHDNVIMCETLLISLNGQSTLVVQVSNLDSTASPLSITLNENSVTMIEIRPIAPSVCPNISPTNPAPIPDDPNIPNILASATHRIQVSATGITPVQVQVVTDTNPNIAGNRQLINTDYYDSCEASGDVDGDRICDSWENGNILRVTDANNQVIYQYVCYTNSEGLQIDPQTSHPQRCGSDMKDIFVEIDWMEGHKPDPNAILQVVKAFNGSGYYTPNPVRLHIQVDQDYAIGHKPYIVFPGYDWDNLPQWKGFDQLKGSEFGTAAERATFGDNWDATQPHRIGKHQVFHYGVFAHMRYGDETTSGIAEIHGNDFLVTMGSFTGQVGSTDQQAGTLMHELGHNLALNHGGSKFDTLNYNPNHLSVMSYSKQFSDIDSDRPLTFSRQSLGQNPNVHHYNENLLWEMDPSYLNKGMEVYTHPNGLREDVVYTCPSGQIGSTSYWAGTRINWDCDGTWDTAQVQGNINNMEGTSPIETESNQINGHNDWNSGDNGSQGLFFDFSDSSNYEDGRHADTADMIPAVQAQGPQILPPGIQISQLAQLCASQGIPANQCVLGQLQNSVSYKSQNIKEITITDVTRARIQALLSLYQAVLEIPESEFNSGFISYEQPKTSNAEIQYIDFTTQNPIQISSHLGGTIFIPPITMTPKDTFLFGIKTAIDEINHHDINQTQHTVQLIDAKLEKSLTNSRYESILNITKNLDSSYTQSLTFTPTTIHTEHVPLTKPIIPDEEISIMIQKVEKFVQNMDFKDDDSDGIYDTRDIDFPQPKEPIPPPKKQWKPGEDPAKVMCKPDYQLILKKTPEVPVCVTEQTARILVGDLSAEHKYTYATTIKLR